MLAISPKGLQSCQKEESLLEKYIRPEGLLNKYLRWLTNTGPKTIKETKVFFSPDYRSTEINRMINYVKSRELVIDTSRKQYQL